MIVAAIFILFITLFLTYMFGMIYGNGFGSKRRKFRIKSTYYEDSKTKSENHRVQWRLLWKWHDYIVDGHYMDYADFKTKEDALDFIDRQVNYKVKEYITYYESL